MPWICGCWGNKPKDRSAYRAGQLLRCEVTSTYPTPARPRLGGKMASFSSRTHMTQTSPQIETREREEGTPRSFQFLSSGDNLSSKTTSSYGGFWLPLLFDLRSCRKDDEDGRIAKYDHVGLRWQVSLPIPASM